MISKLASQQHGVVARRQLLDAGLTRSAIQRRLEAGRLHLIHRGVYMVGHTVTSQYGRWMAAVLACGDGAFLSHRAAAALWRIAESPSARIDVTVGRGGRTRRPGIATHRGVPLAAQERTQRYRIPVTTVSRTVLDLAGVFGDTALGRAVAEADRLELLDLAELARLCDRRRGRQGSGRLRDMVADHRPLPETRSELERRFLRLCRRAGLPRPAVNVPLCGFEVDVFWPGQRLVVELDGYAYHRDRRTFESDRARDAALQLAGYRVLRVTDRRLVAEPHTVIATIRRLLEGGPQG